MVIEMTKCLHGYWLKHWWCSTFVLVCTSELGCHCVAVRMSLLLCSSCGLKFCIITELGANHCLNALCRTNSSSRNDTLAEILKHSETSRTISPEHGNVSPVRVTAWSPHSLRPFAEERAKQLRGGDDPIESTQSSGKRRRL